MLKGHFMKKSTLYPAVMVLACIIVASVAVAEETREDALVALVDQVCEEIVANAPATLAQISGGEHPYKNRDNPTEYVFVYDANVTIVAHPKSKLIGKSYRGIPDFKGKMFRDEIVEGALADGTGWVNYVYQKPGAKGLKPKKTFFKLVKGSDGEKYVVCSGMYRKEIGLPN